MEPPAQPIIADLVLGLDLLAMAETQSPEPEENRCLGIFFPQK